MMKVILNKWFERKKPTANTAAKPATAKIATTKTAIKRAKKPAVTTDASKWPSNIKLGSPVEIKWTTAYCPVQHYTSGLQYSFISKDWVQCCPFVYCRDFLQDILQAMHQEKDISIYGLAYSAKRAAPLYLDRTRLALTNSADKEFSQRLPNSIEFVNQFESKLKMVRSKVRPCSNKYKNCDVYVVDSSSRWMLSPPMISLYTLLLRVGFCHKPGTDAADTIKDIVDGKISPYQTNDKQYIEQAQPGIDRILKYGYARIFYKNPARNYPASVGTTTMHHNLGICSYSKGVSEPVVKYWHRDLEAAKTTAKTK